MADKITLEFTKEQFRNLLDLVFAGNYLITSTNEKDEEKYNQLESMIFSHAKDINKPEFAEFDKEYGGWLPTKEYQHQGIDERISEYDNVSFWDELIHRLALQDVAMNLHTDNPDILIDALLDRSDEYRDFFDNHDISAIKIKGMKPMDKNFDTFRSMNVGEIESFSDDDTDLDHDQDDDDCDCCHHH